MGVFSDLIPWLGSRKRSTADIRQPGANEKHRNGLMLTDR
jgi:hypothetical protein